MNGDGATQDTPAAIEGYRNVRRAAEEFVDGLVRAGFLPEEDFVEMVGEVMDTLGGPSLN